jgi:hypothetical protein
LRLIGVQPAKAIAEWTQRSVSCASRAAHEGALTTELDDPEAFQKAGKCIGNGGTR